MLASVVLPNPYRLFGPEFFMLIRLHNRTPPATIGQQNLQDARIQRPATNYGLNIAIGTPAILAGEADGDGNVRGFVRNRGVYFWQGSKGVFL